MEVKVGRTLRVRGETFRFQIASEDRWLIFICILSLWLWPWLSDSSNNFLLFKCYNLNSFGLTRLRLVENWLASFPKKLVVDGTEISINYRALCSERVKANFPRVHVRVKVQVLQTGVDTLRTPYLYISTLWGLILRLTYWKPVLPSTTYPKTRTRLRFPPSCFTYLWPDQLVSAC